MLLTSNPTLKLVGQSIAGKTITRISEDRSPAMDSAGIAPGSQFSESIESRDIDMQSLSSSNHSRGSNGATEFDKIIKDFKKVLGERKTPATLLKLNRTITGILLATIALSAIDFIFKGYLIGEYEHGNDHYLHEETRYVTIVHLSTNIRSLVNIANGVEDNYYNGDNLSKIDRFSYLSSLI